jgi:hypothetical protein
MFDRLHEGLFADESERPIMTVLNESSHVLSETLGIDLEKFRLFAGFDREQIGTVLVHNRLNSNQGTDLCVEQELAVFLALLRIHHLSVEPTEAFKHHQYVIFRWGLALQL